MRQQMDYTPFRPDADVVIFPGAQVLGDVTAGEGTSFWFNSVCRADQCAVRIGRRCNIQDNAVLHGDDDVILGDDVSVGHGAIVHGAHIGDRVIIGMGAILLDGARIGSDCMVAAGAVVTGKMNAPDGSLLVGSPARVVRQLSEAERAELAANAAKYVRKSRQYRAAQAQTQRGGEDAT